MKCPDCGDGMTEQTIDHNYRPGILIHDLTMYSCLAEGSAWIMVPKRPKLHAAVAAFRAARIAGGGPPNLSVVCKIVDGEWIVREAQP